MTPRSRIDSISCQVSRRACGSRPVEQLVEDRDPRLPDQRERDREALLLAAREVAVGGVALVLEAEVGDELGRVGRLRRRTRRTARGPRRTVIRSGSSLSWSWTPTSGAQPVAVRARVEAEDADRAGVGRPQAGDRFDGGGLAGAVRAEDAEDLALLDGERHAVDGGAIAVALGEVGDFDHVHAPSIGAGPLASTSAKRSCLAA